MVKKIEEREGGLITVHSVGLRRMESDEIVVVVMLES